MVFTSLVVKSCNYNLGPIIRPASTRGRIATVLAWPDASLVSAWFLSNNNHFRATVDPQSRGQFKTQIPNVLQYEKPTPDKRCPFPDQSLKAAKFVVGNFST